MAKKATKKHEQPKAEEQAATEPTTEQTPAAEPVTEAAATEQLADGAQEAAEAATDPQQIPEQGSENATESPRADDSAPPADGANAAANSLQEQFADKCKWLDEIREQEQEVANAEAEYEELKKDASEAKKHFDSEVDKLRKLIRQANEGPGPLYAKPKQQPAPAEPKPVEDWRKVPFAYLQKFAKDGKQLLSDYTIERLAKGRIETAGDYSDFVGSGKWITDIEDIGKESATKIEDAWELFWAEQQAAQPVADVPLNPPVDGTPTDNPLPTSDWRSAKIADLVEGGYGFDAADLEPLAAMNVTTAGQLDEFLQEHSIEELGLKDERGLEVLNALQQWKDDAEDLEAGAELEEELAGAAA